jgi:hypothetical protein
MLTKRAALAASLTLVAATGAPTLAGAAAGRPRAIAATRVHRCKPMERGLISRIRITRYSCGFAFTLLYSFVNLRTGHWWWTARIGRPGYLKGYWNANSIPGDRRAWTCRASMRCVKVAAAAAAPGPSGVRCATRAGSSRRRSCPDRLVQ